MGYPKFIKNKNKCLVVATCSFALLWETDSITMSLIDLNLYSFRQRKVVQYALHSLAIVRSNCNFHHKCLIPNCIGGYRTKSGNRLCMFGDIIKFWSTMVKYTNWYFCGDSCRYRMLRSNTNCPCVECQ